jgi:hypothetical protein
MKKYIKPNIESICMESEELLYVSIRRGETNSVTVNNSTSFSGGEGDMLSRTIDNSFWNE